MHLFIQTVLVAALSLTVAPLTAAEPALPHISARISGADGPWDYASVDAAHRQLLVARGDGVMRVDLATGKVTAGFVPGARVHAALALTGTPWGVSTNGTTNTATLFEAVTGKVIATIPTGAKPDAATYDPKRHEIWVMNGKDGSASVIDPKSAKVIATVQIGGALEFAVLDGTGHLFVNIEDKAELVMVDTAKRQVVRRTALPGCEEPSGLAYVTPGILIAACANGVAKTVVAASGALGPDIAIGPHPDAVLYDAKRHRAYIPSGGDGTLAVIDTTGSSPRALGQISTQKGARTGAIDPETGTIYLPTARFGEAASGTRPAMIPGSFELLVLTR